jgi:dTDP-glucose 4,6-dehydratase
VNYAAQGEGQASFQASNWKHFYRTNVQHLVELTERLHGAPWLSKFIQIGTSELYGSVEGPVDEAAPIRPSSPYAVSKAAFDLHLSSIARVCGFPAVIVRPSNCYGEGQQLHRIIPKAFIYGLQGRRLPLHGGGVVRKSYLHASDLSRAVILLSTEGKLGEVYNVGPHRPITIRRLLEFCAMTLQMGLMELVEEAPEREGQDGCYWLNTDKIRALGWTDSIPLGSGLRGMLDWIEKYRDELLPLPTNYRLRA